MAIPQLPDPVIYVVLEGNFVVPLATKHSKIIN